MAVRRVGQGPRYPGSRLDDDVAAGAAEDRQQLAAFALGHGEFIEGLVEVVDEGGPLVGGDLEVSVRVSHAAAGVLLRAAGGPADHLGDEVLEASRGPPSLRKVVAFTDRPQEGRDKNQQR